MESLSSFPDGIKVLHECRDATIDICFVHGLTGDRMSTWTAHGQSDPWPKTLLPKKLGKARIYTYGYDAYLLRKSVASSNLLIDHATNLLSDVTTERVFEGGTSRPLIFVTHSLGGIFVKKTLLLSRNHPEPHLRDIFNSTTGIIFMGTPHTGTEWMAKWAKISASTFGLVKSVNTSLLSLLQTDDQFLESIQIDFLSMVREIREYGRPFEVTCFFEELPFPVVGLVVPKKSATFEGYQAISIQANHSNMVKFVSEEENGYKRVLEELMRWEPWVR
ncbi:hypothetical protein LY76DRAFT_620075 [Colletotrichum caudatum]|nr:hypothetical protein LY76DRAFT_620075 [Colletotrichum caudatum]